MKREGGETSRKFPVLYFTLLYANCKLLFSVPLFYYITQNRVDKL